MSAKRISAIRKKMNDENLDGLIINALTHVRYLCGFTGSNGTLVITKNKADFFTDFRYDDQARNEVKGAKIRIARGLPADLLKLLPDSNKRNFKYGVNGSVMPVSQFEGIKQAVDKAIVVRCDEIFTDLGSIKDADEIKNIAAAVRIGDTAFERVLNLVAPGVRESELAAELEYQMLMLGSEKPAFDSIIASGYRSAMPHGVATRKKLKKGEFVTFDFGATVNGYVSDMTRTVVVGKATSRQKKIYDIVLRSQLAGIKKIKAGVAAAKVDDACRKIITRAGYGKNFGHGTGHGIGFYIHVAPNLSSASKDKLLANNVITVEPGIYISGWGGVRIEDDVLVTRSGGRVLNKAPKYLLEL